MLYFIFNSFYIQVIIKLKMFKKRYTFQHRTLHVYKEYLQVQYKL